jgi:hypothetical protein
MTLSSLIGLSVERLGDAARTVVGPREFKPCSGDLPGISRWAALGCAGDTIELPGWTTVKVPEGWIALDAHRTDVTVATQRWLLRIANAHVPRVLFGEIRPRGTAGVAKILVSACPVETVDLLIVAMDRGFKEFGADGMAVTRDRVDIGGISTERFVLRYPSVMYQGTARPSTLAAFWATYLRDGAFVTQADIPNFDETDETILDTFLDVEARAHSATT